MRTSPLRPAAWFATGVAFTLVSAVSITQAWSVDAAPGDSDSTVVAVDPPVRILDTRDGQDVGLAGPFVTPTGQKLQVAGSVATTAGTQIVVPEGSTGVLLNVTAVRPTGDGFVSVRPGTATGEPATSNLNVVAGDNVPNSVTVALPTDDANAGQIDLTYVSGTTGSSTDMLVDVVGYLTDSSLDEIAQRLDALETAPPASQTFSVNAVASEGVDADTARAAAPEIPITTFGSIELYAKCFLDTDLNEINGEIFARTSVDGAVFEGSDDLPDDDGLSYLDAATLEADRQLDTQQLDDTDFVSQGESEGFIFEVDGSATNIFTSMAVKRDGAPGGDGAFGPGNACLMAITVHR